MDETPNPNFMKFMPTGKEVMESGTHDFTSARFSFNSPLAKSLFCVDGVTRVFFGKDYISVGKNDSLEWIHLKPIVAEKIQEFYESEAPLFTEQPMSTDTIVKDDDSEAVALIKEILETRIRPMVQEDGGDIEYIDFSEETGVVFVAMKGACTDCPSSAITLKNGIERMLVHYVAEVSSVQAEDYSQEQATLIQFQQYYTEPVLLMSKKSAPFDYPGASDHPKYPTPPKQDIIHRLKVDGEQDFKSKPSLKDSISLLSDLKNSIEEQDWNKVKDIKALTALSSVFLTYLDSQNDELTIHTLSLLKYLIQKMSKRLCSLFEKLLSSVSSLFNTFQLQTIIQTILFNEGRLQAAQTMHNFLCQLFVYCPEDVFSVFIIQINNQQQNVLDHRFRSLCYFRLMLWRFPKKSLRKYFENIRALVQIFLRDPSCHIIDHCYFSVAIMDKRFPKMASKIFRFMDDRFSGRFKQIMELLTDELSTKMEKVLTSVGIEDATDVRKLSPFTLIPLANYIDDIMEVKNSKNRVQEEIIVRRKIRKNKRRRPRSRFYLTYVDESAEMDEENAGGGSPAKIQGSTASGTNNSHSFQSNLKISSTTPTTTEELRIDESGVSVSKQSRNKVGRNNPKDEHQQQQQQQSVKDGYTDQESSSKISLEDKMDKLLQKTGQDYSESNPNTSNQGGIQSNNTHDNYLQQSQNNQSDYLPNKDPHSPPVLLKQTRKPSLNQEEDERVNRVIQEKLKKLKMGNYKNNEPTIDELTEESRATSVDMRMERAGYDGFGPVQPKGLEFPRFRFRRKFRPKSLDPSVPIPGIYSPSSNTPKTDQMVAIPSSIELNFAKEGFMETKTYTTNKGQSSLNDFMSPILQNRDLIGVNPIQIGAKKNKMMSRRSLKPSFVPLGNLFQSEDLQLGGAGGEVIKHVCIDSLEPIIMDSDQESISASKFTTKLEGGAIKSIVTVTREEIRSNSSTSSSSGYKLEDDEGDTDLLCMKSEESLEVDEAQIRKPPLNNYPYGEEEIKESSPEREDILEGIDIQVHVPDLRKASPTVREVKVSPKNKNTLKKRRINLEREKEEDRTFNYENKRDEVKVKETETEIEEEVKDSLKQLEIDQKIDNSENISNKSSTPPLAMQKDSQQSQFQLQFQDITSTLRLDQGHIQNPKNNNKNSTKGKRSEDKNLGRPNKSSKSRDTYKQCEAPLPQNFVENKSSRRRIQQQQRSKNILKSIESLTKRRRPSSKNFLKDRKSPKNQYKNNATNILDKLQTKSKINYFDKFDPLTPGNHTTQNRVQKSPKNSKKHKKYSSQNNFDSYCRATVGGTSITPHHITSNFTNTSPFTRTSHIKNSKIKKSEKISFFQKRPLNKFLTIKSSNPLALERARRSYDVLRVGTPSKSKKMGFSPFSSQKKKRVKNNTASFKSKKVIESNPTPQKNLTPKYSSNESRPFIIENPSIRKGPHPSGNPRTSKPSFSQKERIVNHLKNPSTKHLASYNSCIDQRASRLSKNGNYSIDYQEEGLNESPFIEKNKNIQLHQQQQQQKSYSSGKQHQFFKSGTQQYSSPQVNGGYIEEKKTSNWDQGLKDLHIQVNRARQSRSLTATPKKKTLDELLTQILESDCLKKRQSLGRKIQNQKSRYIEQLEEYLCKNLGLISLKSASFVQKIGLASDLLGLEGVLQGCLSLGKQVKLESGLKSEYLDLLKILVNDPGVSKVNLHLRKAISITLEALDLPRSLINTRRLILQALSSKKVIKLDLSPPEKILQVERGSLDSLMMRTSSNIRYSSGSRRVRDSSRHSSRSASFMQAFFFFKMVFRTQGQDQVKVFHQKLQQQQQQRRLQDSFNFNSNI